MRIMSHLFHKMFLRLMNPWYLHPILPSNAVHVRELNVDEEDGLDCLAAMKLAHQHQAQRMARRPLLHLALDLAPTAAAQVQVPPRLVVVGQDTA
jgi:hypothetical protein